MHSRLNIVLFLICFLSPLAVPPEVHAQGSEPAASEQPSKKKKKRRRATRHDVSKIKKKYWARGQESEIGVVQNRRFSKHGKFQLGLTGGLAFSDPFLNVKVMGIGAGYHFSEYVSLTLMYWRFSVGPSSALETLEETRGATANTNEPQNYYGGEITGNFLYGKLAFFGSKIIYYDMGFSGGLGLIKTESGTYIAPSVGIGQRFFLSKRFSLRLDYRLMVYKEDILEKQIVTKLGEVQTTRTNFSNNVLIGIDFLFGN